MRNHPKTASESSRRPKFHVSSLFLAGAISLTGLFTAQDAAALSGTLMSGTTVTTAPRESSGASGGATLIHAAATASETSSSSSSTSQVNGPTESASTNHVSSTSRRKAQTEEGTTHRRSGGTASTTHHKSEGGKAMVESKDKEVKPLPAPEKPFVAFSGGWESRYIFHGLDIISFNSQQVNAAGTPVHNNSSSIWYVGGDASFLGAHFGLTYVQAVDRTIPFLAGDPFLPGGRSNFTPAFYREIDANLDYTVHVVANILDATVGYNEYFFIDKEFKGTNYQGEAFFRLAYKQIPFVTPSATFYHYVSDYDNTKVGNLNGSLMEFRLDGLVPVFRNSNFVVALAPYVSSIYNIDYLKYIGTTADGNVHNTDSVGGFSSLEAGLKVPMQFAKHFSVTPYGSYGMDLTSSNTVPIDSHTGNIFGQRTHFWGGVTLSYSF